VNEYLYGAAGGTPIARVTGPAFAGTLHFYQADAPGNIIGQFNGATLEQSLRYDPWGTLVSAGTTTGDTTLLRWKGLYWEADSTQLYYVRARWYDPVNGRFASQDPLGLTAGMNQYTYAAGDGINGQDPTGMYFCDPAGPITACIEDPSEPGFFDPSAPQQCVVDNQGDTAPCYSCHVGVKTPECLDSQAATLALVGDTLGNNSWNSPYGLCSQAGYQAVADLTDGQFFITKLYPNSSYGAGTYTAGFYNPWSWTTGYGINITNAQFWPSAQYTLAGTIAHEASHQLFGSLDPSEMSGAPADAFIDAYDFSNNCNIGSHRF